MLTLLLAVAAHAAPLVLPAEAPAGEWAHALALAGLEPATTVTETCASILVSDGVWRLEVRHGGATRSVPIDPPRTEAERERVAVLAASLLRSISGAGLPSLPSLPPPPPPRPAQRPRPAPAPSAVAAAPPPAPPAEPTPAPAPAPVAVTPAEPLDGPIALEDPSGPGARDARLGPWIRGTGGVAWRTGCAPAAAAGLLGGVRYGILGLGVGGAWTSELGVAALGADRGLSTIDALGGLWVLPSDPASRVDLTMGAGLVGGWSTRRYTDSGVGVGMDGSAIVGGELLARAALGPVELGPVVRLATDLARTPLVVDGRPAGELARTQATLALAIGPRLPR